MVQLQWNNKFFSVSSCLDICTAVYQHPPRFLPGLSFVKWSCQLPVKLSSPGTGSLINSYFKKEEGCLNQCVYFCPCWNISLTFISKWLRQPATKNTWNYCTVHWLEDDNWSSFFSSFNIFPSDYELLNANQLKNYYKK